MSNDRKNELGLGLALAICICFAYTAGFGIYRLRSHWVAQGSVVQAGARVFWEAWDRVERHFFGDVPSPKARTYGAIRGSLKLLDPYTVFVEPVPRELEQDRLRGAYGGIGVTIWRTDDGSFCLAPYPGSPAESAGLLRGDKLLSIDRVPISKMLTESDVASKLRGEIGTQVQLTVRRSSAPSVEMIIERQRIEVPSVSWRLEGATTGYVHLTSFTQRTDEELINALEDLRLADATALILDLRGNRGGLVNAAIAVAGQFLEQDDVVLHEVRRRGQSTFRVDEHGDLATPLVVLVDSETASAAEIVAGALQDNGRALLVGWPTFGKGSVQQIYDLSDGSSLHVTTAVWLTPDRHQIDKEGLTPDLRITASDQSGDEALRQALSFLESE